MSTKGLRKIFFSIIFPSIMAILLFVVSIYAFIIPSFEKNMMERKKEMIKELTNTAWSIVHEFYEDYRKGKISLTEAQQLAAGKVGKMRYGNDQKDYFWITDTRPFMIMHPYRSELNGRDLKDYKDEEGKRLFVESANIVKQNGEGYFTYLWQWKDDSTKIVSKLSYVKGFDEWQWIIGTGIYLEDVKNEIRQLERKLLRISLIITIVLIIILFYIIRQSLMIENKRLAAEQNLRISRERYKSLVEASTEGTLLIVQDKIVFSNKKFNALLGYPVVVYEKLDFDQLFTLKWENIKEQMSDDNQSLSVETSIIHFDKTQSEVLISVSHVVFDKQAGYIVVVKDLSRQKKIENARTELTQELQTSLSIMNQPIKHFITSYIQCDIEQSVVYAADLMSRKKRNIVFITQNNLIVGVINDSDLRQRVLAKGLDLQSPVSQIMTAPVKSIQEDIMLFEVMLIFNNENISHLLVKNNLGKIIGVVCHEDILNLHRNSLSFLVKEIKQTEDIDQLRRIQERIPVLVDALLNSGAKTMNITRIISSVADAMSIRLIDMLIEECGPPPCRFSFMAMGSEGRMEQTLATDQDNAIILEEMEEKELNEAKSYFSRFAKMLNKNLDYIGYNYCKGNVMAQNPAYCQPLSVWKTYFSNWIKTSNPKDLLDASIFFDFRHVYGDKDMVDELRNHINQFAPKESVFFYHMAQSIINFKTPSGLQSFDVKYVLFPFVGFTKIYGLQNKLSETNSIARLNKLLSLDIIQQDFHDELLFAYDFLMLLRFRSQVKALLNNEKPDNIIEGEQLTDIEKATLKKIFSELSDIQSKLSIDFKGSVL
jgi:signal-transduction protein with cAMP-binding, CBS, and nucleotidyltransferase domain